MPLANCLDSQIDPKMLLFGNTPGIDIPPGSHDSNEAYLKLIPPKNLQLVFCINTL